VQNSGFFAGKAGVAVACVAFVAPLLVGCAAQPSAPTIFGARVVPSEVAQAPNGVHVAAASGSGQTIFGVPVAPAPRASGGTALASMP
jgi:hypothetical protein